MRKTKKDKKKIRKEIKHIFSRILTILVLGGIFLLLFFICKSFKKSAWDGKNNINFVIQTERTFIYSYHPNDEILNIITLPNDLFIETAKGYGEYKLKNIYELGEMEKIGGGELLVRSLQNFFLAPIDGYVVKVKSEKLKVKSENIERGRLTSLYFCLLTRKCGSDLSWWDLIRIFNRISRLKHDKIFLINIEKTALFKKEKLFDESEALRLVSLLVDDFSQRYFTDKIFLEEGMKISVFNATHYSGLAKNCSRLLRNIGGEIVGSKDADQVFDRSIIYYNDEEQKKTYSFKKICQIFKIEEVVFNPKIEGNIRVVLGRDFAERYY